ncbi:MAG TPA: NAD(P)H-hydrate epimerase [Gemmata sp.]
MFTLSRSEVRELDRRAVEEFGVPGVVLMENAGRGAAELLMRLNPERKATVVLCGPGNNGGDGFVIARHLDNARWPVCAWVFASAESFPGDAATNYQIAERSRRGLIQAGPGTPTVHSVEILAKTHLNSKTWVVDALFGTGLSRALASPLSELVERVNASGCPVLAIDIPSGLDCDTGEPLGPTVRATHTATFVTHKRGFLNPGAQAWTGEVHVIDIGAPRALVDQYRRRTNI